MVELDVASLADVRRRANAALAKQSVSAIFGHLALVTVVLATSTLMLAHASLLTFAAAWAVAVACFRYYVARSFRRVYKQSARRWIRLFRAGTLASSATWGIGGALLISTGDFHADSWLTVLALGGVAAGGVTSLAGDGDLMRLHLLCTLVPTFVAGWYIPGDLRLVLGFECVVLAYAAFLWAQCTHIDETHHRALANTKLLELHVVEIESARLESIEASRVKSEFLANMSHEIRTPMTAVMGYADLLLDPSLAPTERVAHIQTIRKNGEHLMSIVNDILDISKIEAGKMVVERIPVSPAQLIVDVASLMRVRATEKGLGFDIRFAGPVPETIQSDPTRLRQIVMNFAANAIKFTDRGSVTLVVSCLTGGFKGPELQVEVIDSGVGMTEAEQARVFGTFTQADASTTRKYGGTGLGLAISKRLATLLGGRVEMTSQLGVGSRFRLFVPTGPLDRVPMIRGLSEAGLNEREANVVSRVPSLPPSIRVLLAEDGIDNQRLITTYLEKAGANVRVVGDGLLAVETAMAAQRAGQPFDVILMDMQMPELDGYGATSKLRLMGYTAPIVALTAHAMAGDRQKCEAAGCDEYLTKPVDRARLVATIAHFVQADSKRNGAEDILKSDVGDDEDMREILVQFVRDLPERSSAILRAQRAADLDSLKRLTHQLKGSAGGYGFPTITEAASAVERALEAGVEPSKLGAEVDALANLCRRARAA